MGHEKIVQMPTIISGDQLNENAKVLKERENMQKCADELNAEEFSDEGIEKKFINAGIPKRHLKASINDIPKNLLKDMQGFFNKESFYIYGEVGCGKTYLISALLKEYIKNNKYTVVTEKCSYTGKCFVLLGHTNRPRFISVPDLLLKIRLAFKDNSDYDEESIISEFADEKFLILDDIGVEKPTEWVLQTLYTIIDRRNRDMKQTVFTSNYSIIGLKERTSERIVSRIVELCGKNNILNLKGKDRRLL